MLAIVWVGARILSAMAVSPMGKAIESVGVLHGRKNDHDALKLSLDLFVVDGVKVIGNERRGIGATGFVAVDAVHHMEDGRLICDIDFAAWINNRSSGRFDVVKFRDIGGRGDRIAYRCAPTVGASILTERRHPR